MKTHLRLAALSLSALAMGATAASAGYIAANGPKEAVAGSGHFVITVADEAQAGATDSAATSGPEVKVPETKLGAGALSTEPPTVATESMDKPAEPEVAAPEPQVTVPETKLGAGALSTEPPTVATESMDKPAEPEVAAPEPQVTVPETKLGAGALSTEAPMVDTTRKHLVMRGDSYWRLAKAYYGDATMWRKIAEANPEARSRRLRIGAELVIPQ